MTHPWEAKIRRIMVGGQSRQKICKTPSLSLSGHKLVIPDLQEAEIWRITVADQLVEEGLGEVGVREFARPHLNRRNLGALVHACTARKVK
jgi:hypothetical protein